jgi:L-ascorbate metabolism protein UlaG (beta-lactamase superfamily)
MTGERLFLKPNVIVEPLVNQWYAWSHLVAPQTAAMHIANSHLKIMQSFVSAPGVHAVALRNPAMLGGPFINYDASRAGEIAELARRTVARGARLLELAGAVSALDATLAAEAGGHSLEPLYQKVPEPLKGLRRAGLRPQQPPFDQVHRRASLQKPALRQGGAERGPVLAEGEGRPFAFSTPWLEKRGCLHVRLPFEYEGYDELFKMKSVPQARGRAEDALGVDEDRRKLFSSFFTTEAPPPPRPYGGAGVRVRYFGHACLLIESARTSILCDPVVSYRHDSGIPRYTFEDLPERLNFVLITHNHQDQCMFETLLQLRHKIGSLVVPKSNGGGLADPSLKLALQKIGFKNVVEIDEGETIAAASGGVTGIPFLGEHADLNVRTKIAYLVSLEGKSMVCAADSNNIEAEVYTHVGEFAGNVDALFLGMECDGAPMSWLYGPLMTKPLSRKMDQSRRLDGSTCEKAVGIIDRLRPRRVYVYAMGQEPWLTYLTSIQYTAESRPIVESDRLVEECRRRGIESERLYGQKEIHLRDS